MRSLIFAAILSLTACSSIPGAGFVQKAADNAATTIIGGGASTAGTLVGCFWGPIGCYIGSFIGGSSGALLADKTIDRPPPTITDVFILAIEVLGWVAVLLILVPFLAGYVVPSHRESKIRSKMEKLHSKLEDIHVSKASSSEEREPKSNILA